MQGILNRLWHWLLRIPGPPPPSGTHKAGRKMRRCPLCAGHGVTPLFFAVACSCGCGQGKLIGGCQSSCPACGGVGQVPMCLDSSIKCLLNYGQRYWVN